MPLRLLTLGAPLELRGPAEEPQKFTNTKHLALLAYLALEPGAHSREWLTRFIWSSGEAGSMNDALSALRGVFGGDAFPPRTKEVALPPGLLECDANQLVTLCAPASEGSIDQVLTVYRGPFLVDFNARGASSRFVSWVERKRAEFERVFVERCRRELEHHAEEEDAAGIQHIIEAVLKRVSGWSEAEHWLKVAEALRQPSPPPPQRLAQPVLVPTSAAQSSRTTADSLSQAPPPAAGHRQRWHSVALVLFAAAVLVLLLRPRGGSAPAGDEGGEARASAAAAVCGPGLATAQLVDEVFHFGVHARPRLAFAKAWTLQNSGHCSWNAEFRLHYKSSSSARLSTTIMDIPLTRTIDPGDTVTFRLQMRAPAEPGTYDEHWELRDAADKPVLVNGKPVVAARIVIPKPNPPVCAPGQSTGTQLVKKFMDGVVRAPGERFRFGWTLKNTGTCSWPAEALFRIASQGGARVSREQIVRSTRSVAPGQTYTFLVSVETPRASGVYREDWKLEDSGGTPIPIDGHPTVNMQFRVPGAEDPIATLPICRPGEANVRFVDENWLDETVMKPGQQFVKRWTVFNVGSCAWAPNFRLNYASNTNGLLSRSQADRPLGEVVPPWTTYTFEIPMQMPQRPGPYREDWRFTDAAGNLILVSLSPYVAAILSVGSQ